MVPRLTLGRFWTLLAVVDHDLLQILLAVGTALIDLGVEDCLVLFAPAFEVGFLIRIFHVTEQGVLRLVDVVVGFLADHGAQFISGDEFQVVERAVLLEVGNGDDHIGIFLHVNIHSGVGTVTFLLGLSRFCCARTDSRRGDALVLLVGLGASRGAAFFVLVVSHFSGALAGRIRGAAESSPR